MSNDKSEINLKIKDLELIQNELKVDIKNIYNELQIKNQVIDNLQIKVEKCEK